MINGFWLRIGVMHDGLQICNGKMQEIWLSAVGVMALFTLEYLTARPVWAGVCEISNSDQTLPYLRFPVIQPVP
jgi:hypothetical protein